MKISAGTERLLICAVGFLFFTHIFGCFFVIIGSNFADSDRDSWYNKPHVKQMGTWDRYIYSLYFIVTTITTVGYGDQSAGTTSERIFVNLLMICGVVVFTFISGALSSILTE